MEFFSRKNTVCLRGNTVVKAFPEAGSCEKEGELYRLLDGSNCPHARLLRQEATVLTLEYLPSTTALELFERRESSGPFGDRDRELGLGLVRWLVLFYREAYHFSGRNIILGDIHLRNILYLGGTDFCGIDFEEWKYGAYEQDVGMLLAYIASYAPENTSYKSALTSFLLERLNDELSLDLSRTIVYRELEAENIRIRRKRRSEQCR